MQEVMIIHKELSFIMLTVDLLTLFKDGLVIDIAGKECFIKYNEFSALLESNPKQTRRRLHDEYIKQIEN